MTSTNRLHYSPHPIYRESLKDPGAIMLFNSYEFILVFLPITVAVFFLIGSHGWHRTALAWLLLMSLVFYGWWNPAYLLLICLSMLANYSLGSCFGSRNLPQGARKPLLALGVALNLGLLGYFKYAMFAATNINSWFGCTLPVAEIALPLGISFFTFQQVGFLVDSYRESNRPTFVDYCLFVTFFPQLIAGPIVQHTDLLPQLKNPSIFYPKARNLEIGVTVFFLGLFKKLIIADKLANFATPVFEHVAQGGSVGFADAWSAAIAYTLQIYFDFSGYSDMAIGLGALFGIRLPINFNSPYQATSIIDFWRRWHITLSVFLRDYLYIPLGGNRNGPVRRYINLLATMVLGGFWHGAGWTFAVWGLLHGAALAVNHGWREIRGNTREPRSTWRSHASWALTFLVVVIGWVIFRAADLPTAFSMLSAMAGVSGNASPIAGEFAILGDQSASTPVFQWGNAALMAGLLLLVRWCPSVPSLMSREGDLGTNLAAKDLPYCPQFLLWRPTRAWALGMAAVTVYCVLCLNRGSEFLYFRF